MTPLSSILALIESQVGAVQPCDCALLHAGGRILAEDVMVSIRPPSAIALRDGFAVDAAAVADAGPYSPVPLSSPPCRVDVGEPLPKGSDAVAPLDSVSERGNRAEAVAAVSPGDGVLSAGGDAAAYTPLRRAGQRLRAIDVAVLTAAGIDNVPIRVPRIRVVGVGAASLPPIRAALDYLAYVLMISGADALDCVEDTRLLDDALIETDFDAVIAVGGTGSGRQDTAVQTLARLGRVEVHGIAVSPGETAAFGFVGTRPVLLVPGRLDAALAIWLLIGRHLLAALAAGGVEDMPAVMPLKRKVASALGLTELVPVSCAGGMAEPLASGYLSFTALARSDGWIVVPADSEGFAAGTAVPVRSWP